MVLLKFKTYVKYSFGDKLQIFTITALPDNNKLISIQNELIVLAEPVDRPVFLNFGNFQYGLQHPEFPRQLEVEAHIS